MEDKERLINQLESYHFLICFYPKKYHLLLHVCIVCHMHGAESKLQTVKLTGTLIRERALIKESKVKNE